MSLLITEPIKTVNGLLTKALAAESQLIYQAIRKDNLFTIETPTSAPYRILITGDVTADYAVNNAVFLGFDDESVRGGIFTINTIVFNGVDTEIIVNFNTTFTGTGYINNLTQRENYRLEVEVEDTALTTIIFNQTFAYIPNQAGVLDFDVGNIVTSYMKTTGELSQEYRLKITEVWLNSTEGTTTTTTLQAVLASKQLLDLGGANMWENLLKPSVSSGLQALTQDVSGRTRFFFLSSKGDVSSQINVGERIILTSIYPYVDGDYVIQFVGFDGTQTWFEVLLTFIGSLTNASRFGETHTADLLTKFVNPRLWVGWNRTISFLIDREYNNRTGFQGTLVQQQIMDINKQVTLTTDTDYSLDVTPTVKKITIREESKTDAYLAIRVRAANQNVLVSDTLIYRVQNECPNSVMLDWINSLGGIDQWLFTLVSVINVESDAGVLAEKPITTDIEYIVRTKRRFARSFRQRIILRAVDLTLDQLFALEEIKHTESLRVYLTKDGSEFIDAVIVDNFTTEYVPNKVKHRISITIEFPDNFRFEKARKY